MFAAYTLVLAFGVCASSTVLLPRTNATAPISGSIVPGAYIVKFAAGHESADSFYHNLTEAGCGAVHRQTFNADVFSGTSFHLPDGSLDIDQILSFDQVESISPVRLFSLASTQTRDSQDVIEKVRKNKFKRVSRSLSDANDTMTPHIMTGVDKLHADGLDGEGIKIAIIDTGIDYTLPALGAGFGPGYKVAFGTDLVGDAYDGLNTPVPDDDPIDCYGHGTHVAGILGASNDPYVLGVAPNATLGIYKVFGCIDATVANDVLISAFTMAYNEGVDMITSSIGFANGWPEEPWAAAVAAIVAAGTPCMLSAGNDGTDGIFYTSSASAGNDVTSVGSVENTYLPEVLTEATYSINGNSQIPFGYNIATGSFGNISLPIWADTYNMTIVDDGCSGFSANLTGLIALIRRGTCTFDTKVGNALAAGATYVMFYNNVPGTISGLVNNLLVDGAAMVNPEVGATWINALATGEKVILTFNTDGTLLVSSPGTINNVTGGYMDTFTSWGLTNENTIKPVVCAPGGSILSTYLSSAGGYTVMSGTSMATPFIAGVVALYIQSKGYEKVPPQEINAALSLSATPLSYNDGTTTYSYLASVAQQGAGLINAYSMIHSVLTISQANLALNDTANFVKESTINITNTGTVAVTYTFSHEPASNVYTFSSGNEYDVVAFPPPLDTQYSTAIITPSTLTLNPGEDGTVSVSVTPNPDLNNSTLPVYSGYIKITGSDETYSIPYAGVAATMSDLPIVVPGSTFFNSLYSPSTVDFNGTTIRGYTAETPLTFYFTTSWATSLARVDIVGVNETNPVVVSGLDMVGSAIGFPQTYLRRNSGGAALFNGTLADGSVVESGVYKFVLRVAKVFGDLDKGRYEEYISNYFFISTN